MKRILLLVVVFAAALAWGKDVTWTGAAFDLMGGTLTVERFTGDKSAVNGTIAETNPRQGMVLIVR